MLARVSEYLREALGADPGFSGVLASNPVHSSYTTVWLRARGYTLTELRQYVPRGWRRPRPPRTDVGRNCALFLSLVRYAGHAGHTDADVRREADRLREEIDIHRPHAYTVSELADTVRSILRYRARWGAHGWHSEAWLKRQGLRGARNEPHQQAFKGITGGIRSGEARRRKTQERDERILQGLKRGQRQQEIARAEGLAERTVRHIRDRSKTGNEATNTDDPR